MVEVKENRRLEFSVNSKKGTLIKTLVGGGYEHEDEIPIDLIDNLTSFEHPFEKSLMIGIETLAESIKINGVYQAIIVRPKPGGRYEILSGHRRTAASRLAGKEYIKAIINDCDDDTAKLIVTETNTEIREEIFPSERAKAYKIQMEALKNQGKRNDLVKAVSEENNLWQTLPQVKSRDIVAELNNVSARNITDYLRLNELVKPLLEFVDSKKIPISAAVELSYLKVKEQTALANLLESNEDIKVTTAVAEELRIASKEMELSDIIIEATVNPPIEDTKKEFTPKLPKPVYKVAFKSVEKYIKKLDTASFEKLAMADAEELENKIKETIDNYIAEL